MVSNSFTFMDLTEVRSWNIVMCKDIVSCANKFKLYILALVTTRNIKWHNFYLVAIFFQKQCRDAKKRKCLSSSGSNYHTISS